MDVDDAVEMFLAVPVRENLHVAAENGQFPGDIADGVTDPAEGLLLALGIGGHGNVKETKSLFLHLLAKGVVIGDDQRHIDVQLTGAPAPEHVGKAVVFPTHQQDGPQGPCLVADVPVGVDIDSDRGEVLSDRFQGLPLTDLECEAGEEPPVERVGVLMDLGEVPALVGHETGDPCKETDPVGTVQRDEERAGGTHEGIRENGQTVVSGQITACRATPRRNGSRQPHRKSGPRESTRRSFHHGSGRIAALSCRPRDKGGHGMPRPPCRLCQRSG